MNWKRAFGFLLVFANAALLTQDFTKHDPLQTITDLCFLAAGCVSLGSHAAWKDKQ